MRTAGADRRSASTGRTTARRACARRRGSTTRSRVQIAIRRGTERRRARAPARARERGDGRRGHRDLGVEVLLPVLAPDHRHPRVGSRHRSDRCSATATPHTVGDTTFTPLGAPASNRHRAELHAALPGVSVRSRGLRRRAVPDAAPLLRHATTSPFTFVSDEFNGVTLGNDGAVRPLAPAQLPRRCRRPRRRTARAASTSGSTGRSTRRRASRRGARSATSSSTTCTPSGAD